MALWVGCVVALIYVGHFGALDQVGLTLLMLCLALVPILIMGRWGGHVTSQAWRALGAPNESAATYVITNDELVIRTDDGEIRKAWSAVLEIAEEPAFWLFIVAEMSYFLPKRFFSDAPTHRAFIAECLSRLAPEARARSTDAERFAAKAD